MVSYLIYFLIAIGATTVGSLTGLGGGVIIKPLLDILGDYNASTIGMLSSITVFSMAVVSLGKQMLAKTEIPFRTAVPLAIGSVAGGQVGQRLLSRVTAGLPNAQVTVVQNAVLSLLILGVYLYMKNKARIPSKHWDQPAPALILGLFLGVCAAFLGIGGGPINVALIIFLFSYDTKKAAVSSIVIILFSQASKLASVALGGGFGGFDLSMAPVMVVGAIAGGFIGAKYNKKFSEEAVDRAFNAVQLLVLAICIFNIVKNVLA